VQAKKNDSKKEDSKNHRKKSVKEISARNSASKNQESASDSDNSEFTIASVGNEKKTAKDQEDWTAKIQVLENPNVTIKFNLDTGAQANLIPKRLFDKIPDKDSFLKQSKIKLLNYSGHSITNLGKCTFRCKVNQEENNCQLDFFIVETDKNAPAILGLNACQKLKLIERVNSVNSLTDILNDYKEVFSGSGCFGSPQNIVLQENAQPVVHNARKIPLTLKSELNRLERFKIIEKVNEPTDWVNPLMLVRKPSGKLRICLDPKQLNKYIKRQHYQVPLIEELLIELNGATVFSRVDADQGFYQIPLNKTSSKVCTFATPFGRYKFNRLPFGIVSAPEIFQKEFKEIFKDTPGQVSYIDDLLIYGKTQEEHDRNLKRVLERAKRADIKLNKSKCEFQVKEIKFLGHVINSKGIKPDESKIASIVNMSTPKNKKELEVLLGMITYISKFIPNLSELTASLRSLLTKNAIFSWTSKHDDDIAKIKTVLSTEPTLQLYNPNKPVTISADASQHGVGAVLLQNNLPVIYASRALTETEKNYVQIEKELLSIVFACQKFHQYIYGKKIIIENDYKPLESILKKPLNQTPARLQRMLLKLQRYEIIFQYRPGKQLFIADCLSRIKNQANRHDNNLRQELEAQVLLLTKHLKISDSKFKIFQEKTMQDQTLIKLKRFIQNGWPQNSNSLDPDIKQYWKERDSLVILDEVIFKNNKAVCKTWFLPKGVIPQYLIINRSDSSVHIKLDNLSYSHTIIYNWTHLHLIQSFKG
jgi:hypothetical protein